MDFLRYFDGIFVVFCRIWMVFRWNFLGIFSDYTAVKIAMGKALPTEFNQCFGGIFYAISHLATQPEKLRYNDAIIA